MPNAMILCGSAKPDGVTISMCRSASERLSELGYDVDLIVISDLDIRHCTDCGSCRHGKCIIDDDMSRIYDGFSGSDLLILASPVHFSGPSSIIKTAIDRFQTFWFDQSLPHPAKAAAMVCGGSPVPRFGHTVSIFRAFSMTTGMEWAGHMEFPDTDRVGDVGSSEAVRAFIDGIA